MDVKLIRHPLFSDMPHCLSNITQFQALVTHIDDMHICVGHPDPHFVEMVEARKGRLLSSSGSVAAVNDRSSSVVFKDERYSATVRSADCQILTSATKCSQCASYRTNLRSSYHKWTKRNLSPSSSSHVNDRWLTTPERKQKSTELKKRARSAESIV